ncbi:MAG: hypothetical protein UU93_C0001G0020 [Candidatus Amesbacteria bacterium GW2011_GWA2_42_12]|uniref:Tetratricopeptide repeat protein n=1 Tax=Candidatus Amesbacteria bacterium GW2011_GWA2_42_12 TaxID=1618356 RepID=A0A0G0Y929_9BACT|nr:MAG: hypothetical protein UU93_C0001G0020 [Candidatus Amesbacteria bacterium GW2011_GWA2_42_12]
MKKVLPFGLLIFSFVWIGYYNFLNKQNLAKVLGAEVEAVNQKDFWANKVNQFPNYRDGYIQLAIKNWQLGATEEARINFARAREIDPNWQVPDQLKLLE